MEESLLLKYKWDVLRIEWSIPYLPSQRYFHVCLMVGRLSAYQSSDCDAHAEKFPKLSLAAGWRVYADCEHFFEWRFNRPRKWSFAQESPTLGTAVRGQPLVGRMIRTSKQCQRKPALLSALLPPAAGKF